MTIDREIETGVGVGVGVGVGPKKKGLGIKYPFLQSVGPLLFQLSNLCTVPVQQRRRNGCCHYIIIITGIYKTNG